MDFVTTLQTRVVQAGGALIVKTPPLVWARPERKTNAGREHEGAVPKR